MEKPADVSAFASSWFQQFSKEAVAARAAEKAAAAEAAAAAAAAAGGRAE